MDGAPPRDASETRGGCSPFTRASPATSFTRAGAANDRPPSVLTAAKMSVAPLGVAALQASATTAPSAAIDTLALARCGTPSEIPGCGAAAKSRPRTLPRTPSPRPIPLLARLDDP